MEAIGEILQCSLLVAYGQLPNFWDPNSIFMENECTTYQDLMQIVWVSEEHFALRIPGSAD